MPTYPEGLSGGRVKPWAPVPTKPGMGPPGPSEEKRARLASVCRERWCAADRPEGMVKDMVSHRQTPQWLARKKPRTIKKGQAFAKPRLTGREQGVAREEGPRACLDEGGPSAMRRSYRTRGRPWVPRPRGALGCFSPSLPLSLSFFSGVRGQMRLATSPPMAAAAHGTGSVGCCVSHPGKVLECKANTHHHH